MRYLLEISYRGTNYHGWQKQQNALGIQTIIEEALHKILRQTTEIHGSGRTDTGVHARQQFAHFDTDQPIAHPKFPQRLNAVLPEDIAVHSIRPVKSHAHARFDARVRSYEYHIHQVKNPFLINQSYFFKVPLQLDLMNQAAALLATGDEKDYASFSKSGGGQGHTLCRIFTASWEAPEDHRLVFHISANRFLRNMVRAIVGTLIEVGSGRMNIEEFQRILQSRDRQKAGRSVPAEGLYLTQVGYPPEIFLQKP